MKYRLFLLLCLAMSCTTPPLEEYGNFEQGKAAAKSNHTKLFMFFDLYGSSNTLPREYLTNSRIKDALRPYTVIHLMCDDRAKYNDTMTVGEHNSELQIRLTGLHYQPMFCVLDTNAQLLSPLLEYCKKEELLSFIENNY